MKSFLLAIILTLVLCGPASADWSTWTWGDWSWVGSNNYGLDPILYGYVNQTSFGSILMAENDGLLRSIVKANGIYYEFMELYSAPNWRIYARESYDGIVWSDAFGPLLAVGAGGSDNQNGNADPSAIYNAVGNWEMYNETYSGSSFLHLGYATNSTTNPLTGWTYYGSVASVDPNHANWDSGVIHHPSVIKTDSTHYYISYAGEPYGTTGGLQLNIGLATSPDGTTLTKYAGNPVIKKSTSPTGNDTYNIRTSRPFQYGNNWYMPYFGGTSPDNGTTNYGYTLLAKSADKISYTPLNKTIVAPTTTYARGAGASASIVEDGAVKIWHDYVDSNSYSYLNMVSLTPSIATVPSGTFVGPWSLTGTSVGDTAIESTSAAILGNYIYFTRITTGASGGVLLGFVIYLGATKTISDMEIGLYSDNADAPGTFLASTPLVSEQYLTLNAYNQMQVFNGPTLAANTSYWIGTWSRYGSTVYHSASSGSTKTSGYLSQSFGNLLAYPRGVWPASISGATLGTQNYTMYAIIGTPGIWQSAIASDPGDTVLINTKIGTKQSSLSALTTLGDWYWAGGILYVYTGSDGRRPEAAIVAPGVEISCVIDDNAVLYDDNCLWEITF